MTALALPDPRTSAAITLKDDGPWAFLGPMVALYFEFDPFEPRSKMMASLILLPPVYTAIIDASSEDIGKHAGLRLPTSAEYRRCSLSIIARALERHLALTRQHGFLIEEAEAARERLFANRNKTMLFAKSIELAAVHEVTDVTGANRSGLASSLVRALESPRRELAS